MFRFQLLDHTLADITPRSDVIGKDRQLEIHVFNGVLLRLVGCGAQGQDHAVLRGVMDEQPVIRLIGWNACFINACDDFIQRLLIWQLNSEVAQSYCIGRRRGRTFALPGVEANVMVISTR